MSASIIPLNAALSQAGMASHLDGSAFMQSTRPGDDRDVERDGAQKANALRIDLTAARKKLYEQALAAARPLVATGAEAARIAFRATSALLAWIYRMIAGLVRFLGGALERSGQSASAGSAVQPEASQLAGERSPDPSGESGSASGVSQLTKAVSPASAELDEDDSPASRHVKPGAVNPFAALAARTAGAAGDEVAPAVAERVAAAASEMVDKLVANGSVAKVTVEAVRRGLGRVVPQEDEAELLRAAADELGSDDLADAAEEVAAVAPAAAAAPSSVIDASLLGVIAGENIQELCDSILDATRRRCQAELEIHEVLRGVTSGVGVPLDRLSWTELVEEIGGERGRSALEAAQIPVEKVVAALSSRDEALERECNLLASLASLSASLDKGEIPNEQADAARLVLEQLSSEIAKIRDDVLGSDVAGVIPEAPMSPEGAQAAVAQATNEVVRLQEAAESKPDGEEEGARDNAFAKLAQRGG